MHSFQTIIVDLTLITIYATLATLLFKKLKQPTVLGYILAGICAGPFLRFIPTIGDADNTKLWADLGVIFLLFGLGLEFSVKKMFNVGKSATITAVANILFLLFIGYNVGQLLGWSTTDSFFLGSMISMSSTTIINIKKQKFTDLVFGVLVIEDIVGVLMLFLLPTIALSSDINGKELLMNTAKLVIFLVLCFLIGIYLVPTLLKKLNKYLNDETLLILSIGLCFSMVLLATTFGFSSALGAFLMGSILAETDIVTRIEKNTKPLKDFFGSVFFVSVGMMVDPHMILEYAWPIFVITLVVMIGQVSCSCFGFIVSGQPLKTAIHGGFSLSQVGEFAFIIASLGMSIGVLNPRVYPIIVSVSVITTFFTPMMIKFAEPTFKTVTKILPQSWQEYLEQNASGHSESKREEQLWNLLLKNYLLRLGIFAVLILTIIAIAKYFLSPLAYQYLPNIAARIVLTLITLFLISPFLKALIGWETILPQMVSDKITEILCRCKLLPQNDDEKSSILGRIRDKINVCSVIDRQENLRNFFVSNKKIAAIYLRLWNQKKSNRVLLVFLTTFRLILLCFFIMTVIHQFLTGNPKMVLLLMILSVLLLSRSRWLFTQYMKIENQFLDNLNGKHQEEPAKTDN